MRTLTASQPALKANFVGYAPRRRRDVWDWRRPNPFVTAAIWVFYILPVAAYGLGHTFFHLW